MGVPQVILIGISLVNGIRHSGLITVTSGKLILDLCHHFRLYRVFAVLRQLGHPAAHGSVALAAHMVQQPLQVGTNENIHRGRGGGVKVPVPVISAGFQEISQYIVGIGRANHGLDGQAHVLGIIPGQNVAEVAGGHHHIHRLAYLQLTHFAQIRISGEIIDNLRHQTAPVNRIGRREHHILLCQLRLDFVIGKDRLNGALGVVKIAVNGTDGHILTLLGGHLQFLHGRHTIHRVKHQDLGLVNILKAL